MDTFVAQDLELLNAERAGICVSIYLRTHRTGPDILQDPIRLGNLLTSAEEQLVSLGMRTSTARDLLKPVHRVRTDKAYWQFQGQGLALFASDGFFRSFRLPIVFNDLLVVSSRFHLKPLLSQLVEDIQYYVLALSRSSVRLFRGTRFSLEEMRLPKLVPQGMEEAVTPDQNEAYEHYHVRSGGGAGRETAMFYGRGEGRNDENDRILRYFRKVDAGIQSILPDKTLPLVLAGVEYLLPLYRQASTYLRLMDSGITGNVEQLNPEDLHTKAWPIVEPLMRAKRQKAEEEFHRLLGTGKASTFMPEIVPASYQGRISALLVSANRHEWGAVDKANAGTVRRICKQEEQGCEDLYDFAAIQTLLKGGKVFVVEDDTVTDGASIAAVFRY